MIGHLRLKNKVVQVAEHVLSLVACDVVGFWHVRVEEFSEIHDLDPQLLCNMGCLISVRLLALQRILINQLQVVLFENSLLEFDWLLHMLYYFCL